MTRRGRSARVFGWVYNPRRADFPIRPRWKRTLLSPVTRLGLAAGFKNIDYAYVHGDPERLHIGARCSLTDTVFNVMSGDVWVGDDTLFSHGCFVVTGQHRFHNGRRIALQSDAPYPEVPATGRDIRIGSGCFIGTNATILGGVTVGDNVIVGSGQS